MTPVSKLILTKSTFITFSDSKERTSDRRIWNWFSNLVRFESSNDLITSIFKDTSMWWQKKKKKKNGLTNLHPYCLNVVIKTGLK